MTDIQISGLRFDPANRRHEGQVTLEVRRAQDGPLIHLNFLCHAEQPQDCPDPKLRQILIEGALRQAYRMPGFRRGEQTIVFDLPDGQPEPKPVNWH